VGLINRTEPVETAEVAQREPEYTTPPDYPIDPLPEAHGPRNNLQELEYIGTLPAQYPPEQNAQMGHSLITTQATVGSGPAIMLVPMEVSRNPNAGIRRSIVLQNNGGQICYISGSQETANTFMAFPLAAGGVLVLDKGVSGEVWGICAAGGTTDMRVLQEIGPSNIRRPGD
jgi:hypothetical protein